MSDTTTTPRLGLIKPTPGLDDDLWGGHLNQNSDTIDAAMPRRNYGDAAPSLPDNGDTWFNPFFGRLFYRYASAWVDAAPLLRLGHTGTLPLLFPANAPDGMIVTQGSA